MSKITNNFKVVLLVSFFMVPQFSNAQLMDLITDYVVDEIKSRVSNYISNAASQFWNDMVENSARSSIEEKAHELENFQTDKSQMNNLLVGNPYITNSSFKVSDVFNPIVPGVHQTFWESINSYGNVKLYTLGDGMLKNNIISYNDSVKASMFHTRLEDVLSKSVMDSINILSQMDIKDTLLSDINTNARLAILLNNHPQVLKVYINSFSTVLRSNISHLYYWGVEADSHREELPKKAKLIDPRAIKFVQSDQTIKLIFENQEYGTYYLSKNQLNIISPSLLDFKPKDDLTYVFNSIEYSTDGMGRVTSISFPINTSGKKVAKSSVKYKDLCESQSIHQGQDFYTLFLKPYKETPSAVFAFPIANPDDFKTQMKAFKKKSKIAMKINSELKAKTTIGYGDMSNVPVLVKSDLDGDSFELINNGSLLSRTANNLKTQENEILRSILQSSNRIVTINGINLRIRLSPSTSGEILKDENGNNIHLDKGFQLPYIGEAGDFYCVKYQGQNVYVSKQYSILSLP